MKRITRLLFAAWCLATLPPAWGISPTLAAVDDTPEVVDSTPPHVLLTQFLLQDVERPEQLAGYRIAILATDGVDGFDLEVPRRFLTERGATVHVIAPRPPSVVRATGSGAVIRQRTHLTVLDPSGEREQAPIDRFLDQVAAQGYDLIYVPGHRGAVDALAEHDGTAFLQAFARAGKPVFSSDNALRVIARAGLLAGLLERRGHTGAEATLPGPAYTTMTDVPPGTIAGVYVSRDAFEMPLLMNRLVEILVAQPAPGDR